MVNEIDFDTFQSFYIRNKGEILMPSENIGKRMLNPVNIKIWHDNINTKSPDDIKQIYHFFACTLMDVYKYVDFSDFMGQLASITNELVERMNNNVEPYSSIYFYIPEQITKSNMWVTLLVFDIMMKGYPVILELHDKIKFSSDIKHIYDVCHHNDSKILCIYCDDMSYTGNQLTENMSFNRLYLDIREKFDLFIAIPYLTSIAKDKLGKNDPNVTIVFPKNSTIVLSYIERLKNEYIHRYPREVKFIEDIFENPDEYPSFYRACIGDFDYGNPNAAETFNQLVPVYFDHKVADEFSTFKKILFTGSYPIVIGQECEITPLISGCENEDTSEFTTNNCTNGEGFKEEIPCYPTFYKTIQYIINGKPIDINSNSGYTILSLAPVKKGMKKRGSRGGVRKKRRKSVRRKK